MSQRVLPRRQNAAVTSSAEESIPLTRLAVNVRADNQIRIFPRTPLRTSVRVSYTPYLSPCRRVHPWHVPLPIARYVNGTPTGRAYEMTACLFAPCTVTCTLLRWYSRGKRMYSQALEKHTPLPLYPTSYRRISSGIHRTRRLHVFRFNRNPIKTRFGAIDRVRRVVSVAVRRIPVETSR